MKIEELYNCGNPPVITDKVVYVNGYLSGRKCIVADFLTVGNVNLLILIEEEDLSKIHYANPNMLELVVSKSTI